MRSLAGCNNSGKNLTALRAVRFENLTALTKNLTALTKNLSARRPNPIYVYIRFDNLSAQNKNLTARADHKKLWRPNPIYIYIDIHTHIYICIYMNSMITLFHENSNRSLLVEKSLFVLFD